jgi:AcrR family transcriptional regulator
LRKIDPIKHKERRGIILKAAGRCFVRDGFRGASIANICAEAKIGPGNLYHYFESKEAIIEALIEVGLEYVPARFKVMAEEGDPIAALMTEMAQVRTDRGWGGQTFILDLLAESARNASVTRILRKHSREIRDLLAEFIRSAQKLNQLDAGLNAEVTASIMLSFIDGTRTLTLRDPKIDAEVTAEHLRLMLGRFLRPPAISEQVPSHLLDTDI